MTSLLDAIKNRKEKLKSSTTLVTRVDGRKFLENFKENSLTQLVTENNIGYVIDTKPDNVPVKIIDFLYLGSQDCCDLTVLRSYNISYILSVGIEVEQFQSLHYKFVECLDLPETDLSLLPECIQFIQNAIEKQCNILVHCNAGVSRSASVVIGYLILHHNFTYQQAYDLVKSARSCIKPNSGFERQLKKLKV